MTRSAAGLAWQAGATFAEPALRLLLARRLRAGREISGRIHERRGIEHGDRPPGRLLWVHAASVGESIAVLPVLTLLTDKQDLSVLLTTGTATSARLLGETLPRLGLTKLVRHRLVPLDVPRWIERFLGSWRPDAAAFVESELWPNILAALRRRRLPTALINARLSSRSADRWSYLPGLAHEIFATFTVVWARSEEDSAHLARLGCRVDAVGDLKEAADPSACDPDELERLQTMLDDRPRWLAASTHPGEDEIVAQVQTSLASRHDRLLTIVAPRHPERGSAISSLLGGAPQRSRGQDPEGGSGFWISDTLGEMGLLYRLAPIVLIGRSLTQRATGGQNPLEAARLGCTIASGVHVANFKAAYDRLRAADALTFVTDAHSLAGWLDQMLTHPASARQEGQRGREATLLASGLIERAATMLAQLTQAP